MNNNFMNLHISACAVGDSIGLGQVYIVIEKNNNQRLVIKL